MSELLYTHVEEWALVAGVGGSQPWGSPSGPGLQLLGQRRRGEGGKGGKSYEVGGANGRSHFPQAQKHFNLLTVDRAKPGHTN